MHRSRLRGWWSRAQTQVRSWSVYFSKRSPTVFSGCWPITCAIRCRRTSIWLSSEWPEAILAPFLQMTEPQADGRTNTFPPQLRSSADANRQRRPRQLKLAAEELPPKSEACAIARREPSRETHALRIPTAEASSARKAPSAVRRCRTHASQGCSSTPALRPLVLSLKHLKGSRAAVRRASAIRFRYYNT